MIFDPKNCQKMRISFTQDWCSNICLIPSVLHRLVRALRPGGWLCVTDTDFLTVRLSESDSAFDSVISAFSRVAGWEMQLGPKLPAMMENAGLTNVGAEAWQRYERAGASTLPLAMTYRRFRDMLIDLGVKATDIDLLVEKMTAGAIGVSARHLGWRGDKKLTDRLASNLPIDPSDYFHGPNVVIIRSWRSTNSISVTKRVLVPYFCFPTCPRLAARII